MVTSKISVDFSKPAAFQVGHLGESYDEWVHQPILTKEGPTFYENGFFELLTLTPWWVVPLVWLPVAWWFVSSSLDFGIHPYLVAPTMVAGVFLWTIFEYLMHRFIYHMRTTSYWGITFHYLIHGYHHKHPMDQLRLVTPPTEVAIILALFWNLVLKPLLPSPYSYGVMGGGMIGYVMYDCTHYYLHHARPINGITNKLKRYHMDHHYKMEELGFGVTSTFWDKVFGTMPPKSMAKIE